MKIKAINKKSYLQSAIDNSSITHFSNLTYASNIARKAFIKEQLSSNEKFNEIFVLVSKITVRNQDFFAVKFSKNEDTDNFITYISSLNNDEYIDSSLAAIVDLINCDEYIDSSLVESSNDSDNYSESDIYEIN